MTASFRFARARRLRRVLLIASIVTAAGMLAGTGIAAVGEGRIVYAGYDDASGETDLYSIAEDGTDLQRLTFDGADKGHPEWSPDASEVSYEGVAYDSGSCCSRNVYVINADGSDRRQLTESPDVIQGQNFAASWAPDGSWLVFVSDRGDVPDSWAGDREIYRMNADGGAETQLTATNGATSDEAPAVSPDGSKIAFASDRANSGSDALLDIYTMNADGSDVQRLTFDGAYAYPLSRRSTAPAWSPDGTRIAFESTRNGNHEIWVMDADGSDLVNVSDHAAADTSPEWSPDGTEITFTSTRAGQEDVWAVAAPAPTAGARTLSAALAPDVARAATEPRNLTPGPGRDARTPDWGAEQLTEQPPADSPPAPGPGSGAPTDKASRCTIEGGDGADVLVGTPGADVICGFAGADVIRGGGGPDVIKGAGGSDRLAGGAGGDRLNAGAGADRLRGGRGRDVLRSRDGVLGNDELRGGRGADDKVADATEAAILSIP